MVKDTCCSTVVASRVAKAQPKCSGGSCKKSVMGTGRDKGLKGKGKVKGSKKGTKTIGRM